MARTAVDKKVSGYKNGPKKNAPIKKMGKSGKIKSPGPRQDAAILVDRPTFTIEFSVELFYRYI